jgi:hypothetical protein
LTTFNTLVIENLEPGYYVFGVKYLEKYLSIRVHRGGERWGGHILKRGQLLDVDEKYFKSTGGVFLKSFEREGSRIRVYLGFEGKGLEESKRYLRINVLGG